MFVTSSARMPSPGVSCTVKAVIVTLSPVIFTPLAPRSRVEKSKIVVAREAPRSVTPSPEIEISVLRRYVPAAMHTVLPSGASSSAPCSVVGSSSPGSTSASQPSGSSAPPVVSAVSVPVPAVSCVPPEQPPVTPSASTPTNDNLRRTMAIFA